MNELFEKIYIKSEADLPKEKGFYETGIGIRAFNPEEKLIKPFQSDSVEFWMKCVDYYLRPVEQNPDCYEKEFAAINKQKKALIAREDIEHFIEQNRKICWEAEFENNEYCVGENTIRNYFLKLSHD